MNYEAIAHELRRLRLERGKSRTTVAEDMHCGVQKIYRIEKAEIGSAIDNLTWLELFADYYEVDLLNLIRIGLKPSSPN